MCQYGSIANSDLDLNSKWLLFRSVHPQPVTKCVSTSNRAVGLLIAAGTPASFVSKVASFVKEVNIKQRIPCGQLTGLSSSTPLSCLEGHAFSNSREDISRSFQETFPALALPLESAIKSLTVTEKTRWTANGWLCAMPGSERRRDALRCTARACG